MSLEKRVGRQVGALLLLQTILFMPVFMPGAMLSPATGRNFLQTAAGSGDTVRVAVLLSYLVGAVAVAIALAAAPVFRRHGDRWAMLYLVLAVAGLATQVVEGIAIHELLALSTAYAAPGAPQPVIEALGPVARERWRSIHFTNLLLGDARALVLFTILFRFALVPRALAVAGLVAFPLATAAVIMALLGRPFSFALATPAGVVSLGLMVWLLARGFSETPPFHRGTASQDATLSR